MKSRNLVPVLLTLALAAISPSTVEDALLHNSFRIYLAMLYHWAKNIRELLEKHGFHTHSGPKSRLPSIIVTNLITPRRNPCRAIEISSDPLHARHEESIDMIDDQVQHFVSDEYDKITEELREIPGFINVRRDLGEN